MPQAVPVDEYEEDLFDSYFAMVEHTSESPWLYHRWTLISAVAALLGRQARFALGHEVIYPNMYVCLMGSAGSRKSSAINVTKKLLEGAGYNTFSREKSSSQKFICDLGEGFDTITHKPKPRNAVQELEDDELEQMVISNGAYDMSDETPSEVYITAGELEDFLGANDAGFLSLLTNLWDNKDHYSHGKMTSEDIYIHEPTVNLIGGTTPTTFATVFPPEVIGQGMLSRLLLIHGGGARCKITIPPKPDPSMISFFVEHLKQIKEQIKGDFTYTKEAFEVFDTVYQYNLDLGDNRLDSYTSRRHVHFYKLCMVLAACELTTEITRDIAIKANTILHWTERLMPTALGHFGKNINSAVTQAVVEELGKHPHGIHAHELFSKLGKDFRDMKEYGDVLKKLRETKDITTLSNGSLRLITMSTKVTLPFVDFELLREFRDSKKDKS